MKLFSLINYAFNYVIQTSKLLNIDESHALRHSMEVYHFANEIYNHEISRRSESDELTNQKNIIMCSAILHDMCDKKYMSEQEGIERLNSYLIPYVKKEDLDIINKIIQTMSYSTVKKNGYPQLNTYNTAYHIVRESDLLAAYDVERCIIYQMMHEKCDYISSIQYANSLFEKRVFKYIEDQLFVTEYSKEVASILHSRAQIKLKELNEIHKPS